jgi:hypothetical protein
MKDSLGIAGKLARAFIDSKLTPLIHFSVDSARRRRGAAAARAKKSRKSSSR